MLYANADERVLGYLGRALSLELSAVQLYSTQAQIVAFWGLDQAAEQMKEEAKEEAGHADRIIGRMLALGVAPGASQLRPVKLGKNLSELLLHDQAFELELIQLYSDAVRLCAGIGDHDNRAFFAALLEEEESHARHLDQWLKDQQQSEFVERGSSASRVRSR